MKMKVKKIVLGIIEFLATLCLLIGFIFLFFVFFIPDFFLQKRNKRGFFYKGSYGFPDIHFGFRGAFKDKATWDKEREEMWGF